MLCIELDFEEDFDHWDYDSLLALARQWGIKNPQKISVEKLKGELREVRNPPVIVIKKDYFYNIEIRSSRTYRPDIRRRNRWRRQPSPRDNPNRNRRRFVI
jgi:hypothetical protein